MNLWTVACQAPLSMGFFRQGYWSYWSGNSSYHALLQGIFMTQRQNPHLVYCRQILYYWAIREAQSKGHPYFIVLYFLCFTKLHILFFFFSNLRFWQSCIKPSFNTIFFNSIFSLCVFNIFIILITLKTFSSLYFYDDL